MKKVLLGTTALLGAGLVASPAFAADGIKLGLGGFFKSAYMVNFDDDSEGEAGNETNTDGFFSDSEVHFTGSTVLDNGLEVGARIELEGENASDQIDEAWIYFSGGFGEVRIGSQDDALGKLCLVPPGGTGNFSAFSPPEWAANTLTSNSVCTGLGGDSQKLLYISPNFAGFQLGLSYDPSADAEDQTERGGAHVGMPINNDNSSRHNLSTYLSYSLEGDGWGLNAGAGASFEGHVEQTPGPDRDESQDYQAALNVTFGNFAVGGVFEYYNDALNQGDDDIDAWVAGAGIAYTMDAWTVGAQYSHADSDNDGANGGDDSVDRAMLTGNYAMGPGINLDAEVAYTWADESGGGARFADETLNNYDSLEIGVGTAITF
ncbi:MAG TPA: porin [Dongiaceae bacterium]|jgi:predicted porin|nr:porin [Dongiaceae bacterium]